jgi:hypothetical protein
VSGTSASPSVPEQAGPLRAALWAVFLACSWTWCIGMLLPTLLVRDAGFWAWVGFAVPNCLGAAAMAWVLAHPGRSERLVREHAAACAAFSIVTIAFHLHFVTWFVARLVGIGAASLVWVAIAGVWIVGARKPGRDLIGGLVVLAVSAVVLVAFVSHEGAGGLRVDPPTWKVAWLAVSCLFGFALSPYLDLTFHRALRHTSRGTAKVAFAAGFAGPFLAMILFSLLYAGFAAGWMGESWWDPSVNRALPQTALRSILGLHMIVQTAFTVAIHLRALVSSAHPVRGRLTGLGIALLLTVLLQLGLGLEERRFGMDGGELIFRVFMGCYGLVFPAYVWLCMLPAGRGDRPVPAGRRRYNLIVWAITVTLAAPCFFAGFIVGDMAWLVPGVGIAVLARIAIVVRS